MTNAVLALALCIAVPSPSADKPFSAAEYKRILLEQRSRIKSMYGSFTAETAPDEAGKKAKMMRNLATKTKVTFAWSGDKRFMEETEHWLNTNLDAKAKSSITVYNGKDCRHREGKTFRIQKVKSSYSELNQYLTGAMRWPMTASELAECQSNPAKSKFLPYFLDADDWRVRPKPETIDGVECVVLEQAVGGRRLWLDPKRGYCMLRLEHDKPGTSNMLWILNYFNFREIIPGIFFPMKAVTENIRRDKKDTVLGKTTTTMTVSELRFNDVPDKLFVLEPNTGDMVFDQEEKIAYTFLPSDDKTLDTASEEAKVGLGYGNRSRSFSKLPYFLAAFAIGSVLALAVWRALPRKADPI